MDVETVNIDPAKLLPQAYPFLLIDRIVEFKKNEKLVAVKNITGNEWVFEGQGAAVSFFPETLLIETCAQAALAFYYLNLSQEDLSVNKRVLLAGAKAEFFQTVSIGDQLHLQVEGHKQMGDKGFADVESFVNSIKKAEVRIFYSILAHTNSIVSNISKSN